MEIITINLNEKDAEVLRLLLARMNPAFLTKDELRVIMDVQVDISNTVSTLNIGRK